MRKHAGLVLLCLLAAACGQPAAPPEAPPSVSTVAPQETDALASPEITAQIKALPAPYNEADYTNGRRVFAQCRSCHQIDASAGTTVGPNLHGVFGRKAGSLPGFSYSEPMKSAGWTWDEAKLDEWIASPAKMLPGTRMTFAGLRDPKARRDVVAYLKIETAK